MDNIQQALRNLFQKNNWTAEDRSWLLQYLEQNDTTALQQLMQQQFSEQLGKGEKWNHEEARQILDRIHQLIEKNEKPARIIRFPYWKRAVAAAILLLLATGAYFLLSKKEKKETEVAQQDNPVQKDVMPGGNKAVLTLGDGSYVVLDSIQNGMISQQGSVKVLKLENGQLSYTAAGTEEAPVYNTVSTPRGGEYQLTLADGSKVWLNAASSLRFPARFSGTERRVELTGEAYFEVAKNSAMPFTVNVTGQGEVEVLGTHFNINSYADESTINTTLLEGRVKVTGMATRDSKTITPGQQAELAPGGRVLVNSHPDMDEVMAWKNGNFSFEGASIQSIMRQISRWYDLDVSYQGKTSTETFSGVVRRDSNLSQLLKIMEQAGVRFRIEGKKILVL